MAGWHKLSTKSLRQHISNMEDLAVTHTQLGLTRKAKQVSKNLREARKELGDRD